MQHVRWAANRRGVKDVIVTDAAFNPAKQVADIEDLLRQKIDLLIYWPVDDASVTEVLKRAVDAGDARALLVLGDAYDPTTLTRLGAIGVKGDASRARDYYQRAREAGLADDDHVGPGGALRATTAHPNRPTMRWGWTISASAAGT